MIDRAVLLLVCAGTLLVTGLAVRKISRTNRDWEAIRTPEVLSVTKERVLVWAATNGIDKPQVTPVSKTAATLTYQDKVGVFHTLVLETCPSEPDNFCVVP